MAPRCPGSGVVPGGAPPEVCTSAAVRLTGAVGGLLPGRPFPLAANGCHLLPAQRAKRGAACFLPSLTSYFNSSLSNTSFLPPSFWEKKGGGPSSSFASLMICQFNLNYRKMGYTDGSNFLHKRICTWLEATQFPQLSPSQKAHTTVISVGLCFPDAVNRDGCTDKGALFCLFPDLWMYLFEPSHRHKNSITLGKYGANHQHRKLFPLHAISSLLLHPLHCLEWQFKLPSAGKASLTVCSLPLGTAASTEDRGRTEQRPPNCAPQWHRVRSGKDYWRLSAILRYLFNWCEGGPLGSWKLPKWFEWAAKSGKHKHLQGQAWPHSLVPEFGSSTEPPSLKSFTAKWEDSWEYIADTGRVSHDIRHINGYHVMRRAAGRWENVPPSPPVQRCPYAHDLIIRRWLRWLRS